MSEFLSQDELDELINASRMQSDEVPPQRDPGRTEPQGGSVSQRSKLELILDIPVNSRVVVGKTRKKLHDLLNIKPGMVIETDTFTSEFVELYVNDHMIALGEVVVVGENYGLRIKQIVTPTERIRKLNSNMR